MTTEPESEIVFQDVVENSRLIAETASDAIITIDEDSKILFVNRAAVNIFGYAIEEMLGSELTMLMPEYLRHLHRTGLKNYVETGSKHIAWEAIELPGLHRSGKEISLELSFGEFRKEGRRYFTGIARDISRRKRDERRIELQHSVTRILANSSLLAEATPKLLETICVRLGWQLAAFWQVNQQNELECVASWRHGASDNAVKFEEASRNLHFAPDVGFPGKVWANKEPIWVADYSRQNFPRSALAARSELHTAFGFPIVLGQEILGVIELFSNEKREADPATFDTLATIGTQIGQFIERRKGEEERVIALAHAEEARVEAEALAKQLTAVQRITDAALARLSLDEVMTESLTRIREVLNVDTVAILLLEKEGDELVAWAAHGLEEEVELGVRIPVGEGFAGKVVAEAKPLLIPDVSSADVYNPLIREKGIKTLLGVPLLAEGRPIGVLHVGKLEFHQFNEPDVRLLELAADRIALAIENARLYEVEKVARAEAESANKAKDEFLTILSHELRTPLTPIIGWVHMMENGILPSGEFNKALAVVNKNAYGLKRLINDLLDMSAILSGKMRLEENRLELSNILEESVDTMRSYAQEANVELRLRVAAAPLFVKGDRTRLNQTFCNLLDNAIKFSPAGGSIDITLDTNDSEAAIRIKDEGDGIPVEFLPHVFERFRQADASRTRNYGGLGLGLALVKSFVEAHGGTVSAASDGEGKGSTFTVKLPLEVDARADRQPAGLQTQSKNHDRPTRILIVEDQTDTLEMLATTFRNEGYDVLAYDSPEEALRLSATEPFDLLISDIAMPVIDGLQLVKELRKSAGQPGFPAIALTGYAAQNDAQAALAAGFDLHLSKPIDPDELVLAAENLLRPQNS